ncbi:hypothetical protein [Microbacterium oleivorans]|uniref:Uncharacterized protein n=1 Tax=Microbacterium oleivorans TaxID=273677 RepID=A0A7D5JXC0_9MICO|nr:hypothetical protein [Microbacterium oleivorans]QLD10863.1 hypothetical protein HW566_03145 [Microbacterium oleivorans]
MPEPDRTEHDPDRFGYPTQNSLDEAFQRPSQFAEPLTRKEHESHARAYAAYLDGYFRTYDAAVRDLGNPERFGEVSEHDVHGE